MVVVVVVVESLLTSLINSGVLSCCTLFKSARMRAMW